MFRKLGLLLAAAVLAVLAACGGSSGSSIPGQPDGLPAAHEITNDHSNDCAGQGLRPNVTADLKAPFKGRMIATRKLARNGNVVTQSALELRYEYDGITWQVTTTGSFVCDAYAKYNDTWKHMESRPLMMLGPDDIKNGKIKEVYVTAYDPALAGNADVTQGVGDGE